MHTISNPSRSVLHVTAPNGHKTMFGMVDMKVDGHTWILLVELDENSGPSITNNSEHAVGRAKAAILQRDTCKPAFGDGDRIFEAYEYRMRDPANQGIDPQVMEVVSTGGAWIPIRPHELAHLATPLCILMRCWDDGYLGSREMKEDIMLAGQAIPAG